MVSTNDCVGLVDDVEDKGEIVDELNEQLEGLQVQKELFYDLEVQIVKKSVDLLDTKNAESVDGDSSQELRMQVTDGAGGDKLTSASVVETKMHPLMGQSTSRNLTRLCKNLMKKQDRRLELKLKLWK